MKLSKILDFMGLMSSKQVKLNDLKRDLKSLKKLSSSDLISPLSFRDVDVWFSISLGINNAISETIDEINLKIEELENEEIDLS